MSSSRVLLLLAFAARDALLGGRSNDDLEGGDDDDDDDDSDFHRRRCGVAGDITNDDAECDGPNNQRGSANAITKVRTNLREKKGEQSRDASCCVLGAACLLEEGSERGDLDGPIASKIRGRKPQIGSLRSELGVAYANGRVPSCSISGLSWRAMLSL
jgi:hypothetical protein